MASIIARPNGHHWIQFKRPDNSKKATLRLGKCSREAAEGYKRQVERLVEFKQLGQPLDAQLLSWLKDLPSKSYERIAAVGLIDRRAESTVAEFADYFMRQQVTSKELTLISYSHTIENLKDFFGPDRDLASIKPGDADDFKTYLLSKANKVSKTGLKSATAKRRLQRASTVFRLALRKGIIESNPFDGVRVVGSFAEDRYHFVDIQTTYKILDACHDWQFRLLFALVRFGGLRSPSETKPLTWDCVNWEEESITFRSPKTEHIEGRAYRTIPIFRELKPYLEEAWEITEEGGPDFILPFLQTCTGQGATSRLKKVCTKAKVELWPKPWVNLRSTRQTEIESLYGIKCACDWIGNSASVAKRHYLQVTKEQRNRAVSDGAGANRQEPTGGVRSQGRSKKAKQKAKHDISD